MNRWGEFEILDEIGHGGFGTVYRAFHPALAREVALKLIGVPDGQPREIERALEEARRLAKVQHRNVVTVHDARYLDGNVGICMELIHGESILQIVERQGRFGADETKTLAKTLCRALGAVHRVGVIHSDVKAQNVMREDGGRIVLMDFGAGRQLREPDRTTHLQIIGTPAYMAPEIFRFKDPSPASDIYSLGVLLFFVLTGTFPVDGRSMEGFAAAHARHERRYLGDLRNDLPEGLIGVIEKALEPRRRDRYKTPGAMMADLSSGHVSATPRSQNQSSSALAPQGGTAKTPPSRPLVTPRPRPVAGTRWQSPIARIAAAVGGLTVAIWLLGLLASNAYDVMFGLTSEFADESLFDWLETGLRTLPLPLFYMLAAVTAVVGARFVWRVADRLVPGVHSWAGHTSQVLHAASTRAGLTDGPNVASAVLVVQVLCLAIVNWQFRSLLLALTTPIAESTADIYTRLSPSNENEWLWYCGVTSILALASAYTWIVLLRRRVPGTGVVSSAAGITLTAIFVVMFAAPWKILYRSTFRMASFQSERCYIVAERATRTMLLCGGGGMRSLVIDSTDPALRRLPVADSIFDAQKRSALREDGR